MTTGAFSPKEIKSPREKIIERHLNRVHSELEEGQYKVTQSGHNHHGSDSESDTSNLKTAGDGQTVLIPQPSDDPDDPLNWSWGKKHAVFLSLLPGCLLTDFVITWGTTMFELQAMDWKMTVPNVAHSISGAIFMQVRRTFSDIDSTKY
jgi:hypothetical protein